MTQSQNILKLLKSGASLNRLNCWEKLGVLEAPARISELRGQGHKIETRRKQVINRYGEKVSIAEWHYAGE
tara:strand:- start:91 stop:303 length:213 start_codon:yes stop_codon:yes gene_type:complete